MGIGDLGMGFNMLAAAGFNMLNCWRLWLAKKVQGVSISSGVFFALSNLWANWFWISAGYTVLFVVSLAASISSLLWVGLAWYFTYRADTARTKS